MSAPRLSEPGENSRVEEADVSDAHQEQAMPLDADALQATLSIEDGLGNATALALGPDGALPTDLDIAALEAAPAPDTEKAPDAVLDLSSAALKNRDFVKFGHLPHFVNRLATLKPFVRVKISADDHGYTLGRVSSTQPCEPYPSSSKPGAPMIDFELIVDLLPNPVKVLAVSNTPPQAEEMRQYHATVCLSGTSIEQLGASIREVEAGLPNMRTTAVESVADARVVQRRNSTLRPNVNVVQQLSTLQREIVASTQSQAEPELTAVADEPASPTRATLAMDDPSVTRMMELESHFSQYVDATNTETAVLARELTLRNRKKNSVSMLQAAVNHAKYPRVAKFEDSGTLWEADERKRKALCEEYDELKASGDSKGDKGKADTGTSGTRGPVDVDKLLVDRAVEARRGSQREFDEDTQVATPPVSEPASLKLRMASHLMSASTKRHRAEQSS